MSNTPTIELITKLTKVVQPNSNDRIVSESTTSNIEMLWLQVLADDIDAYEAIHNVLYPMLFNYGKLITSDIEFVNAMIKEVFVQLWINRDNIDGKRLLIEMVRAMRHEFLIRSSANNVEIQDRIEQEIKFLNKVLNIEWDGVLQILKINSCTFFN